MYRELAKAPYLVLPQPKSFLEPMLKSFTGRQGLGLPEPEATILQDATSKLRHEIVTAAYNAGLAPAELRRIVCRRLRKAPDHDNNIPSRISVEIRDHLSNCAWHHVYDIIEDIARSPKLRPSFLGDFPGSKGYTERVYFHNTLNKVLREEGIGWKLIDSKIAYRGDDAFKYIAQTAPAHLDDARLPTAARELREAMTDLSRRPEPDLSGALHHALAAVECAMRNVCEDKKTLGALLKDNTYKGTIPPPLDEAVEKTMGILF